MSDLLVGAKTVHDPTAAKPPVDHDELEHAQEQLYFVEAAAGKPLEDLVGTKAAQVIRQGQAAPSCSPEEARKSCALRRSTKSAYLESAPDETSLTVRGAVSRYLEPDPFSGFYWTKEGASGEDGKTKADTWPISPLESLPALSSVYAWSSILPGCGNAIARNVESQGHLLKETVTIDDQMPEELKKAVSGERRRLRTFLRHAFGSEDTWESGLLKARRDREGIGWRTLEVLRTPPPHLRVQPSVDTKLDAGALTSNGLFGLFGGAGELTIPGIKGAAADGGEAATGATQAPDPRYVELVAAAIREAIKAAPQAEPDWSQVDYRGRPYGLRHVEAETLRWCPACAPMMSPVWRLVEGDDDDPPEVRVAGVAVPHYERHYETRRWRLIIHERRGQYVYFQEFGDPRIVDSRTGAVIGNYALGIWPDLSVFPPSLWANELLCDSNPDPTWSPYGMPWWWGDQTLVLGLIGAEQAIHSGIVSPKIPRVIMAVIGTHVAKQLQRVKEKTDRERENAPEKNSEMMVVEVTPPGDVEMGDETGGKASPVKIEQIKVIPDDLYGPFIDRARKIIRGTKGLSNKALGESEDDSFASAESSLIMDDHQVFGPERQRTESWLERLWGAMRVRFHEFHIRGPKIMSSDQRKGWLEAAVNAGADTPERSRQLVAKELGENWPQIEGDWGDQPWQLTLAQAKGFGAPGFGGGTSSAPGTPGGPPPSTPPAAGTSEGAKPSLAEEKTEGERKPQGAPRPAAPRPLAKPAPGAVAEEGDTPGTEQGRAEKAAGPQQSAAPPPARAQTVQALRALKAALIAEAEEAERLAAADFDLVVDGEGLGLPR